MILILQSIMWFEKKSGNYKIKFLREVIQYIYNSIMKKINHKKYWQFHYDIAASMYKKDKSYWLNIYKKYKSCPIAQDRISFIENELNKKST